MVVQPIFTTAELSILEEINKGNNPTFTSLYRKYNKDVSYVKLSKSIINLEKRGIIKRERNKNSRREIVLSYCYDKLSLGDLLKLLR